MKRNYTEQEIIKGLRNALKFYANPRYDWKLDVCKDDCSGFYKEGGEIARQALNRYHEHTIITGETSDPARS